MSTQKVNTKQSLEALEEQILAPYATHSTKSQGRARPEAVPSTFKTLFMEDRDRVLHAEAFRRLKHKTQVFLTPSNDLYRTRLTHTLEVSVTARTLARIHKLNEDLAEAIALAHDLGHPPFGHAGEEILNTLAQRGFSHTKQSLRIVDILENQGQGLNLSYEVRDGIARHSKSMGSILTHKKEEQAHTLEGQIVRIADRITYLIHDIDDAIRAEILHETDIPSKICTILGTNQSSRFAHMLQSLSITEHHDIPQITIDPQILEASDDLKDFLFERVYQHPQILEQARKAQEVIERLYRFFELSPQIIHAKMPGIAYSDASGDQHIIDYLAMMTDSFALRAFDKYLSPKKWFTATKLE